MACCLLIYRPLAKAYAPKDPACVSWAKTLQA